MVSGGRKRRRSVDSVLWKGSSEEAKTGLMDFFPVEEGGNGEDQPKLDFLEKNPNAQLVGCRDCPMQADLK